MTTTYVHTYKFIAGSGGLVSVHDLTSSTCKSDWLKSRDWKGFYFSVSRWHGVLKGGLRGCARVEKRGCTLVDGMGLESGDSDSDPLLGMSVASTAWTAVVTCDCSCGLRTNNEC